MRTVRIDTNSDAVIGAMSDEIALRNRAVMTRLLRHLHASCRDVNPSPSEWLALCAFLRRAGEPALFDALGRALDRPATTLPGGAVRDRFAGIWVPAVRGDPISPSRPPASTGRGTPSRRSLGGSL